jgi:low temperature requirement protein LtrA
VAIVAERALRRAQGEQRARLARDAYSYLHLPMVAGIILAALGMERVLEYVGHIQDHDLSDPLTFLPLVAMYGGTALYLLALVAFRYRIWRKMSVRRVMVSCLLVALVPLGVRLPAVAALGLLTAIMVGLIAVETVRHSGFRERVRHEEGDDGRDRVAGEG